MEKKKQALDNERKEDTADTFKFNSDEVFEITIAPDNEHQYLDKKDRKTPRYVLWRKRLASHLQQYDEYMTYYLLPEITHPQSSHHIKLARLHVHGIIKFRSRLQLASFLVEQYHRFINFGLVQFNKYRPDIWEKYMYKEMHIMQPYCDLMQVKYPITNVGNISLISGGCPSSPPLDEESSDEVSVDKDEEKIYTPITTLQYVNQ